MALADKREIVLDVDLRYKNDGAMARASNDLGKVDKAADGAGKSIADVGNKSKSTKKNLEDLRTDAAALREEFERTTQRIRELQSEVSRGGKDSPFRRELAGQRQWLQQVRSLAKELEQITGNKVLGGDQGGGVLEGILGGIPKMGGVPPALIAGGAAIGVALAPPIAAAVSGAILGAVGIGGVVGGAVLAARDPRVQSAWKQLGAGLMHELEPVGDAFVDPVAKAADIFRNSFDDAEIVKGLAGASALVEPLARGIGGFIEKIGPGLEEALQGARPVFDMLSQAIPALGDDFGDALSTIGAAGPAAARGLGDLLDVTGELTKQAAAAGAGLTAINNLFPATAKLLQYVPIGGFVQVLGTVMEQLAPKTDAVGQKMTFAANATRGMGFAVTATTTAINALNTGLDGIREKLNLKQVQEQNNEALVRLREEVKAHGTDLRATTEAGVAHRQMLLGMVEGYAAERDANIKAGMDANVANAKFREQVVALEALAVKLGFAKQGIWDLIGALRNVPSQVNTAIILDYQTRGVPAGEHSGLRIGELFGARAAGGPVDAGRSYLVGERGPEVLTMGASNGYITPNSTAFGGASGGGMGATARALVVNGGGLGELVFEWLRTEISSRGGTLAVLGLRS